MPPPQTASGNRRHIIAKRAETGSTPVPAPAKERDLPDCFPHLPIPFRTGARLVRLIRARLVPQGIPEERIHALRLAPHLPPAQGKTRRHKSQRKEEEEKVHNHLYTCSIIHIC